MAVLLDTNILLRLAQSGHHHSQAAKTSLDLLRSRGETLHIASQNLIEFWAIATRPACDNDLDLTPDQTIEDIAELKHLFNLLPELPLHSLWEQLVVTHQVSGKSTHDARLVAAALAHQIDSILTFNLQDFARYSRITVLNPLTLI